MKPFAAETILNMYSGSELVGKAAAMEGKVVHGKAIPALFQKVAVNSLPTNDGICRHGNVRYY